MGSMRQLTPVLRFEGLHSNETSSEIGDNEAQAMQNCITWGNILSQRGGITKFNTIALRGGFEVGGLYKTYESDGTEHFLAFTAGVIHTLSSAGVPTYVILIAGATAITRIGFETMNDLVILTDINMSTRKYTMSSGLVASLGGSPPKANYVKLHKKYLFLAHINDGTLRPSRIHWSADSAPETWGANEWEDVRPNDGDFITGLTSHQSLHIYKNRSIHGFSGSIFDAGLGIGDQLLEVLEDGVGCIAPKSLVTIGDIDIFLAADGIRIFDGASSRLISHKVNDLIEAIPASMVDQCVGGYDPKNEWYWFAYNDSTIEPSTVNNSVLIYDMGSGGVWYKLKGINIASFSAHTGAGDRNEVYIGSSDGNSHVYEVETSNKYDAPREKNISNFETGVETWTATGTGAFDGTTKEGKDSYKLTATATNESYADRIGLTLDLTAFLDAVASPVTDKIEFYLKVDTVANLHSIELVFDTDDGDFDDTLFNYTKTTGFSAGWQKIQVLKSAFTENGSPDWSTVVAIRIYVKASAAGTINVNFDDLRMVQTLNTAIDSYWDTKKFDFGRPEISKRFKKLYTEVDRTTDFTLAITGYYDNAGSNSSLFNAAVSASDNHIIKANVFRIAKNMYLRFRHNTLNEPMELIKYSIAYMIKSLK